MLLYQPEEINKIKNPRTAGTVRGKLKGCRHCIFAGTRADTTVQEMILYGKSQKTEIG